MKIKLATDGDKMSWNEYCDRQINLPPLSRFEWKYVLEEAYGVKTFLIMALDEKEKVCGILPIYEIRDYSGHPHLYSLKFGLVAENIRISADLVKYAQQISHERNATGLTFTPGYDACYFDQSFSTAKTVILDISSSEDAMWKIIGGKARNMVRKSRNDGVVVEQGVEYLKAFYSVYSNRMLQKGVRIHSLDYFENIIKYMGAKTEIFIARNQVEVLGGMFLIYSADTGAYVYGGYLVNRGTSPNQLMLWEMVRFCISKGIKYLDLGESIEGSGNYNFKIWFGGRPKDIYYYDFKCDFDNLPILLKSFNSLNRDFLRYSSYLMLHYGTPNLKRKAGIWKRQKGPLQ